MTSRIRARGKVSAGVTRGLVALLFVSAPALAGDAAPPRIASINLCTDQMLLKIADPGQIVGLSPYARDPSLSWLAAEAARFPSLSGEAEDVLLIQPDIVLAGSFTKRATRDFLKDHGLRVEEFEAAQSIADIEAQIRRLGDIVGHPERAADEIARIQAAVARARASVARRPLRVLDLSRRGWVSGSATLTSSLLASVGLRNAARDLDGGFGDFSYGGFAPLEAILAIRPDVLLISEPGHGAGDQGQAFLLHPALTDFYPPARRMIMPERLTTCGGPMIVEALDQLVREIERVAQ